MRLPPIFPGVASRSGFPPRSNTGSKGKKGGSDASNLKTVARKRDGGYVLNGTIDIQAMLIARYLD